MLARPLFRRPSALAQIAARRTWVPPSAPAAASLDLSQTAAIALSGSVGVSGDIQIGTSFDIAQSAAIGLSATASISGDIQSLSAALDLAQTAAVALAGSVSVTGDIQFGTGFDLAQTNVIALSGVASVSGDVQSSLEPVAVPRVGAGKSRRKSQRYVLAIDGKDVIVSDYSEAQALIDRAKEEAEAKADEALQRANASQRRPIGKVIRDARKALKAPSIEAPPELADYARKVIADIQATYDQRLRDIEITALMRQRERQQEEDDEEVLMLIA